MESLPDTWLVDTYYESIMHKLDEPFIDLLLMEILRRKIPIVQVDSIDYALPLLQSEL